MVPEFRPCWWSAACGWYWWQGLLKFKIRGSQWPSGLKRRSAADRLLGFRVRMPPGTRMSVFCEFCVLSGSCVCIRANHPSRGFYRLCCIIVWDPETAMRRRPWPAVFCYAKGEKFRILNLVWYFKYLDGMFGRLWFNSDQCTCAHFIVLLI